MSLYFSPSPDAQRAAYGEVGANYRAIDDLRLRLLALLPLATGTGILLLGKHNEIASSLAVTAGVFGVIATISLFFYELHGIQKCAHFIHRGKQLEKQLQVRGAFTARPHEVKGVVSELLPAKLIYPSSLAGWVYVALSPASDSGVAYVVFVPYVVPGIVLAGGVWVAFKIVNACDKGIKAQWESEDDRFYKGVWPHDPDVL